MSSGKLANCLGKLVVEAGRGADGKYVPEDLAALAEKRGHAVASAVRSGCKAYWRRNKPDAPHTRPENAGVLFSTIAGLAGVTFEWQDGDLQFSALSPDEAETAILYGINEMNGFAPWVHDLARAHPNVVREVLCKCIAAEWELDAKASSHYLIYDLAWNGEDLAPLVRDFVCDRFRRSEPANVEVLRHALSVLVCPNAIDCPQLRRILAKYAGRVRFNSPHFLIWTSLWLQSDPIAAMARLARRLEGDRRGQAAMQSVFAHLAGRGIDKPPAFKAPRYLVPEAIRLFIPFVYRYVHRKDDLSRSGGGAYTVTERDDAERFRGILLGKFAETGAATVEEILQSFLRVPLLWRERDYIRHLLDGHTAQSAETNPWRPKDIRTFAAEFEKEPTSDVDLFETVTRRLDDIQRWVESGEDSPREEVRPDSGENGVRRWLARRLRDRANGRYSVPEEWELDARVRPDLRVIIPDAAPVSLELKVAEEWSVRQLLEGLEQQLVGKYLRDRHARFGIYVLAQFNRMRRWKSLDGTRTLDADEVLLLLRERANQILKERADISGLFVLRIHFTREAST